MSYKKLPPFEFIKTHGILGLKPGSYKTGEVAEKPTDTDTVIEITRDKAEWYRNGKLHREDGPAFEWSGGTREWWLNGQLHREEGPAAERSDGTRYWWLNGQRHREEGPAIERSDGTREWYRNGQLHREDVPAIERLGDVE